MKTANFLGEIMPNSQLTVPPEVASQVPSGEKIEVELRWGSSNDETAAWRAAGRRKFEAAYCADDSVYEQLIHDAPTG